MTAGYVEGGPIPTEPDARRAYYRQQAALTDAHMLVELSGGYGAIAFWFSLATAAAGFTLWYHRVQRFDDAVLRMTAEKLSF